MANSIRRFVASLLLDRNIPYGCFEIGVGSYFEMQKKTHTGSLIVYGVGNCNNIDRDFWFEVFRPFLSNGDLTLCVLVSKVIQQGTVLCEQLELESGLSFVHY